MDKSKLLILECIAIYISLGLNWGAILVNRTLPLWIGAILSIGWFLIFMKINELYVNKDIKVFNKIKLTYFGALMGFVAYLIIYIYFY